MSWTKWGQNVGSLSNAREGDIVVINGSSGEHVGFFVRASNGRMTLLGGNQSDQVKESTYNLSSYRIVAVRRPPNVA
jgi:hydrogenase maturation factor